MRARIWIDVEVEEMDDAAALRAAAVETIEADGNAVVVDSGVADEDEMAAWNPADDEG